MKIAFVSGLYQRTPEAPLEAIHPLSTPRLAGIPDKCGEPICTVFFSGSYNRPDYFGRTDFAAQCDRRKYSGVIAGNTPV